MSRDLNLCQFIGRLGNDPEIRMTTSGTATATLSIACGDDYKDKNSGQKVEQTNWIRAVAFGRTAEVIRDYLKKGSKIYFSGKQVTRKWQNQSGQDQYTTEININELQMLDSKQDSQQQGGQQQGGYQQRQQPNPQQAQPSPMNQNGQGHAQAQQANYGQQHQAPPGDFDSDIPF